MYGQERELPIFAVMVRKNRHGMRLAENTDCWYTAAMCMVNVQGPAGVREGA
jgi:hypothetical protein